MGLFRKKEAKVEEELPELPKLPEFPKLPELPEIQKAKPYEREIKSLPSFPSSGIGETLSQEAVKSALAYEEFQEEKQASPLIPETLPPKEKRTVEIAETFVKIPKPEEAMLQPSMLPSYSLPALPISQPQFFKKEPVYIRIDKFKSAVAHFQEIQSKVYEIENLLKKIKETKQKEDAELRYWEKEIETVKARLDAIDKNIFSKLE